MFGLSLADVGWASMAVAFFVVMVVAGLRSLGFIKPPWEKKIDKMFVWTGKLEKKDDDKPPVWYCKCALCEVDPKWQEITTSIGELKALQGVLLEKMDEVNKSNDDMGESVRTVYAQLNQLLDSLIKRLE